MLEEIASVMGAFSAKTEYLGIFTGERPVIFIGVAKSPRLASLHKSLCKVLCEAVDSKAAVYSETHWIPHITLAYGDDVNRSNIGPVMERLAFRDFHHEFVIDNLAVLEEIPEKGIVVRRASDSPVPEDKLVFIFMHHFSCDFKVSDGLSKSQFVKSIRRKR
jgi:2'-5' RNA ligase